MKYLKIVAVLILLASSAMFSQWNLIEIPGNTQTVNAVKIIDTDNFMGISYGLYFNTTNNGSTWNLALLNGHSLSGLEARDANRIYISGSLALESKGFFYKSTDNGASWIQKKFDSASIRAINISDIALLSNQTIFVCGDYNIILKSTDDGDSWKSCYNGDVEKNFRSISFGNDSTGYVLGSYGKGVGINRVVYKSTDGGEKWDSIATFKDANFRRLQAFGNDIVYIAGQDSVYEAVYKSTDGGKSWSKVWKGLMKNSGLWSMHFVDEHLGFIGAEEGAVYKTKDGGTNWSAMPNGSPFPVGCLAFLNERYGFCSAAREFYKWDNSSKVPIIETVSQMTFESTAIGDSLVKELEIINMGDLDLEISSIYFGENQDSLFSFDAETPIIVVPFEIKTIPIKFTPKETGAFNSSLLIESNAGNAPKQEVLLEGTGVEPVNVKDEPGNNCQARYIDNNTVMIDCAEFAGSFEYSIFDLMGRLIDSGQTENSLVKLSPNTLSIGSYMIVAVSANFSKVFIIAR